MLVLFKTIIKKFLFRLRYLGKKVCFQRGVVLGKKCTFEGANNIGINTVFDGKLGYASYIGSGCCIRADIGRFSSISNNVIVTGGNHPTNRWVSTHPAFYSPNHIIGLSFVDKLLFEEHAKRTAIGNDVWIGDSAIILEGVKIGDGAIVGAGAVVTKDVDPYAIVVGVPARTIKKRFTDDVIERLLQMNWWDKDLNWLQNNAHLFSDYELLLKEERV